MEAIDGAAAWLGEIDWVHFATIPLFTGVVGWLINWSGLIMLFSPVRFHGVRVPGLAALAERRPNLPAIRQHGTLHPFG